MEWERSIINETTKYTESLAEVEVKQYPLAKHGGPTHVADQTWICNCIIPETCEVHTLGSSSIHGCDLFDHTMELLLNNESLWNAFYGIFANFNNNNDDLYYAALMSLFQDITPQFVYMGHNNLWKKFKSYHRIQKSKSLLAYLFPHTGKSNPQNEASTTKLKL